MERRSLDLRVCSSQISSCHGGLFKVGESASSVQSSKAFTSAMKMTREEIREIPTGILRLKATLHAITKKWSYCWILVCDILEFVGASGVESAKDLIHSILRVIP